MDPKFKIISFNLHGLNQGELLLKYICDEIKPDVLFIQEHWLCPDSINKLQSINSDFLVFGISAMDSIVATSILKGRPFEVLQF
jgi:hypothetical protein